MEAIIHNNDIAETTVLGAFLVSDKTHDKIARLRVDDFYSNHHRNIFKAIRSLWHRQDPIDIITVSEVLRDPIYTQLVTDLSVGIATTASVDYHIDKVLEASKKRALWQTGHEILQASDEGRSPDEIMDSLKSVIEAYEDHYEGEGQSIENPQDTINLFWDDLLHKKEHAGELPGVPSGFPDWDANTTGFHDQTFSILAGRPGMGKTTLALNIMRRLANYYKLPTWLVSLEMPSKQIMRRLFAAQADIPQRDLMMGELSDEQWSKLEQAKKEIEAWPITITESQYTPAEIEHTYKKFKTKPKLIIVDHIALMSATKESHTRIELITYLSKELAIFAKRNHVALLGLAQLSRGPENQKDKRPQLKDLRESGSLEQDAHNVFFIYRDEYYNPKETTKRGEAELIIAKSRDGPTGTVELHYDLRVSKFKDDPMSTQGFFPYMDSEDEALPLPDKKEKAMFRFDPIPKKDGSMEFTDETGQRKQLVPNMEHIRKQVEQRLQSGKTLQDIRDSMATTHETAKANGDKFKSAWTLEYLNRLDTICSDLHSTQSGTVETPKTLLDLY